MPWPFYCESDSIPEGYFVTIKWIPVFLFGEWNKNEWTEKRKRRGRGNGKREREKIWGVEGDNESILFHRKTLKDVEGCSRMNINDSRLLWIRFVFPRNRSLKGNTRARTRTGENSSLVNFVLTESMILVRRRRL